MQSVKTHKVTIWAGILLAQIILFYLLSKTEWAVIGTQALFHWKMSIQQMVFSFIPFSVGDVFYILLIIYILVKIIKLFSKSKRKNAILSLLKLLNFFYFIYQISWGLLYFQPPIIRHLPQKEATLSEEKQLTLQLLDSINHTRKFVSEDQFGVFKIKNINSIKTEILNHQNKLPKFINIKSTEINNFKPSIFQHLLSQTGIMGYYNPFTTEAQYNSHLPDTALPFTIAHESAHQLGIAREQEANFIAYLIGKNAKNLDLKYSCQISTFRSLVNKIAQQDIDFSKQILAQCSPAVKRDLAYEKRFRQENQGITNHFFAFTNDLFLKSNQQEGSITYSYFIDLMIRYERNKMLKP